jgi:hypothetical protein
MQPFIKKNPKLYFTVSKKSEKILDVANDVCYEHAKSQCEILCILGYRKMTKSGKFCSFEM